MQPETTPKTKQNLEASRENTKNISPVEQWDQVAFKLIGDTLAPKGYKQINSGKWRGLRIANAEQPGIVRSKVSQCQKITAQMVRTYREKVRRELTGRMNVANVQQKHAIRDRDACRFWQVNLKRRHQKAYEHYRDQSGLLQILINQLDQIGIK